MAPYQFKSRAERTARQTLGRSEFSPEAFFQGVPKNARASARFGTIRNAPNKLHQAERGFGLLQGTPLELTGSILYLFQGLQ
jgi:hypothetical protein